MTFSTLLFKSSTDGAPTVRGWLPRKQKSPWPQPARQARRGAKKLFAYAGRHFGSETHRQRVLVGHHPAGLADALQQGLFVDGND
jgi:hypothetical protein